jgi:hypothetical protein
MPLENDMNVKMKALVKQLSKIILNEDSKVDSSIEEITTTTPKIVETTTTSKP